MSPLGAMAIPRSASVLLPTFRPAVTLSATTTARKPAGNAMPPSSGSGAGLAGCIGVTAIVRAQTVSPRISLGMSIAESTAGKLALGLVDRRADHVLRDLVAVVRQALVVDAGRVRVALLLWIGRLVPLDRAFMLIHSHI